MRILFKNSTWKIWNCKGGWLPRGWTSYKPKL